MKTTFRPFILILLAFTLSEVKCGKVTIKIDGPKPMIDQEGEKPVSVLITHGEVTDPNMERSKFLDFTKFTCLEENQSFEIIIGEASLKASQVIVYTSFDFGTYKVHNYENAITEFDGNNKVCFFNGYFKRDESAKQDKLEFYLKFITNEKTFDFTKILSLFVMISEQEISTILQSIQNEYTENIKQLEGNYDVNTLAVYNFEKEEDDKDTKVKLNGQTFELNGLGMFYVFFIDPKYRPESQPFQDYYEVSKLIKITYANKEVNIIFPDPESTNINGQPII